MILIDKPRSRPRRRSKRRETVNDVYYRYFEAMPVFSPELKERLYRLRYNVYCAERQILDPALYPDGLERDSFDVRAAHSVLLYRPSGQIAGTIRVLFPDGAVPLPTFAACSAMSGMLGGHTSVELSRFAIARDFRRRWVDGNYGSVTFADRRTDDNRRLVPHVGLGLFREALASVQGRSVTHVVALMEPALLRTLEHLGLHFAPVGELVDYHGIRQPCFAKIESLLRRMKLEKPEIWDFVTDRGRLG